MSLNWSDTDELKSAIESTINVNSLHFRYLMLSAVKRMQRLLDCDHLGRVYHQCIKHDNGSVFFVTVRNLTSDSSDKTLNKGGRDTSPMPPTNSLVLTNVERLLDSKQELADDDSDGQLTTKYLKVFLFIPLLS